MKKKILSILGILLILSLMGGCSNLDGQDVGLSENLSNEQLSNEIIRFHVIANSDSEEDQNLKLKVRDRVIEYISSKLIDVKNIDNARKVIIDNKEEIENISRTVIEENGYTYNVQSMLSRENFPDKYYGDLLFPQGEYEAMRILIGEASGQNWWCVMFPPLCFVDETIGNVNSSETEERLNKILADEKKETNSSELDNGKQDIKLKFKFFEIFKKN